MPSLWSCEGLSAAYWSTWILQWHSLCSYISKRNPGTTTELRFVEYGKSSSLDSQVPHPVPGGLEAMMSPSWRLRSHRVVLAQPCILRKSSWYIRLYWSCAPWQWSKWAVKKRNNFLMAADFLAGKVSSELCMSFVILSKPTHVTKNFDFNKSVVSKKPGKKEKK